ncbi:hypothetical protein SPHINGO8BC_150269 [Sphingobacterium multivorum]|uniref:Uncharacterized protein n=1 Tax=Sphingobacterium multivorum TaxID=28454 RepID=A0A654A883_SPHMU|nr:hypothetical protein SPHINGO8BC_150269 [Sphingobacterium multivorum]
MCINVLIEVFKDQNDALSKFAKCNCGWKNGLCIAVFTMNNIYV